MIDQDMAIDADSLKLGSAIRSALGDPTFDVAFGLKTGAVKITRETLPGYNGLLDLGDGRSVLIRHDVKFTYFGYREEREIIARELAAGRGKLAHVIACLRQYYTAGLFSPSKLHVMNPQEIHGHVVVAQPFMGMSIPMRREFCVPFTDLVLTETLAEYLSADVDAVLEIGCGVGANLTQIADRNPHPGIDFFGGEVARNGLWSLEQLARLAGLSRVRAIPFDIYASDFSCLKGKRRALIFSHFALVYANPFPDDFFRKAYEAAAQIDLVLFEPVSYELFEGSELTPMFPRKRAQSYGICTNLWAHIRAEAAAGRFTITKVVPDIVGKSAINAVSMIHLSKIAPDSAA